MTPCFTAICPECTQIVAVAVAPIEANRLGTLENALSMVREWKRQKLLIGNCTVDDVRSGKVSLEHSAHCSKQLLVSSPVTASEDP